MPTPTQSKQGQQRHRRRMSRFAIQLQEKQDLKKTYGLKEEQLKGYYRKASKVRGETGPMLISLLERRLDNVLFRAGFAETRPQARQMANHRLFEINGQSVDIPSIQLRKGDVVTVRESKRGKSYFESFEKRMQNTTTPSWILIDPKKYSITITGDPSLEEAQVGVDIRSIIEYFAR